jgi:hypothetical protein
VVVGVIVAPLLLRGSKVLMEENDLSSDERREFEAHAVGG